MKVISGEIIVRVKSVGVKSDHGWAKISYKAGLKLDREEIRSSEVKKGVKAVDVK